ncbi:MAG: hypothetical protein IKX30_00450 [Victivallales bacterium]|nr:hypothetical protein [Victivallales bacterium]
MKRYCLIIFFLAIKIINATTFNFALGNSTTSQTFHIHTPNGKYARYTRSLSANTSINYFKQTMMGEEYIDDDSFICVGYSDGGGITLDAKHLSGSTNTVEFGGTGDIAITISAYSGSIHGSGELYTWGVTGTLTIQEVNNCPNTSLCSSSTCEYCKNVFCAVHDQHHTGIYTHHESANQPETTHTFCTNDPNLLQQWRSQLEGTCPDCGKFICKLCPHSCLDMPCPNGQYCQPTTCQICHGTYCGRHMIHLCQNYTEANNHTGNENINVQTTITGQAQVSVNITDNTTTTDMSQTNSLLGNIDNNTQHLNTKLDAIKGSLDTQTTTLSNKLDGVKSEIQNQTSALSGKIDDAKSALNDMASQNHQDLNSLLSSIHGDMSGMENNLTSEIGGVSNAIGDTNSTLSEISGKLDDLGDVNVDMSGTNGILGDIKTDIASITTGDGNLGLGGVGTAVPNRGVGSEIVQNTLTGSEIENVQKVTFFDQIKTKLSPPSLDISTFDTTWEFDIPTLFSEPMHFSVDLNDNRLSAVRQMVRALSSVTMVVTFTFGIVRMIRQY